jgi:hypothetical protein
MLGNCMNHCGKTAIREIYGVQTRGLEKGSPATTLSTLARIFHELRSRDHEDGRATWQPQGVGFRT